MSISKQYGVRILFSLLLSISTSNPFWFWPALESKYPTDKSNIPALESNQLDTGILSVPVTAAVQDETPTFDVQGSSGGALALTAELGHIICTAFARSKSPPSRSDFLPSVSPDTNNICASVLSGHTLASTLSSNDVTALSTMSPLLMAMSIPESAFDSTVPLSTAVSLPLAALVLLSAALSVLLLTMEAAADQGLPTIPKLSIQIPALKSAALTTTSSTASLQSGKKRPSETITTQLE